MIFRNRTQAGIALAEKLKQYADTGAVLLAIPRGRVPVAIEIARETRLPPAASLCKKDRRSPAIPLP